MGWPFRDHDDFCRANQRSDRAPGSVVRLAASSIALSSVPEHCSVTGKQRDAGVGPAPGSPLYGWTSGRGENSCTVVVCHSVPRSIVRRWPVCRLETAKCAGSLHLDQPQQRFLLCPDSRACLARPRRLRRIGSCSPEIACRSPSKKHPGSDFSLLAFHGCSLDLSVALAVDEALTHRTEQEAL